MHFNFGSIASLLLLFSLPCFYYCKQSSQRYYFPKLQWIKRRTLLFSWEMWLKFLIFSLLVLALAKPFLYESKVSPHKKGRDLILALDASGSMGQSGFDTQAHFRSKYESAIHLATEFIKKRQDDNMGIVIFGTFAYTSSPLTYDLNALSYLLQMTNVGIAGESTAIGDALMQALRSLSYGQAKNKAIILITDGYHNAGSTAPKEAVRQAIAKDVTIYTIGLGKKSDYDIALLQTIAKKTGGKSYEANDADSLAQIYEEINLLEPSNIRSERYRKQQLLIFLPLILVLLVLWFWRPVRQRRSV